MISWKEIKARATAFSKNWENEKSEHAESQSFLNDFFQIFDVPRKKVATFEQAVPKTSGHTGHIDLFWRLTIKKFKTSHQYVSLALRNEHLLAIYTKCKKRL